MEVTALGHGPSWSPIDPIQVSMLPYHTHLYFIALAPPCFTYLQRCGTLHTHIVILVCYLRKCFNWTTPFTFKSGSLHLRSLPHMSIKILCFLHRNPYACFLTGYTLWRTKNNITNMNFNKMNLVSMHIVVYCYKLIQKMKEVESS